MNIHTSTLTCLCLQKLEVEQFNPKSPPELRSHLRSSFYTPSPWTRARPRHCSKVMRPKSANQWRCAWAESAVSARLLLEGKETCREDWSPSLRYRCLLSSDDGAQLHTFVRH
ncbi:hypothetical protein MHYP_G00084860 [Metynnis hypsauchen]